MGGDWSWSEEDTETVEALRGFVPDRVVDVHAHL